VGMPAFSYIRNERDSDLETTKGNYTTIDGGVADSHFGSEADFSRLLFQNSTYHAFGKNRPQERKFVFARSTRIGVENVFGNTYIHPPLRTCTSTSGCRSPQLIPLPERFFSGGGNSHRGFGLNQAGPRDLTSGFPLGGSAISVIFLMLSAWGYATRRRLVRSVSISDTISTRRRSPVVRASRRIGQTRYVARPVQPLRRSLFRSTRAISMFSLALGRHSDV